MMTEYARIASGIVVELFTPPAGFTLAECFPADLAATFQEPPAGVTPAIGWTVNGTTWAAPAAVPLTLAQQAAAMIGAGLTISSTGTPALDGLYSTTAAAQQNAARIAAYVSINGKFPGAVPSATLAYLDASGAPHVFPTTAEFLAFYTAAADFVADLETIALTNAGTLPAATATIP